MSKQTNKQNVLPDVPFVLAHRAASVCLVAVVIFAVAGVTWWKQVYNNPRRVFEQMLANNLSTTSVTRHTSTESGGSPVDKTDQISFAPPFASRSLVVISQSQGDATNKVVTETLGTLKEDYSRYVSIETDQTGSDGKKLDYSSVQGIWGKTDTAQERGQYFSQNALSLVPFANLDNATRKRVLTILRDKKAYDVQYAEVKPKRLNGKSALVYPVKVNTAAYVEALQIIAEALGLGETSGLNPEDYKDQPPVDLTITVDKLSRHIMEVDYSGQQTETYSAYGLSMPISLPAQTVSVNDLQQKIQEIQ